jgi:hypothetical protein
MTDFHTVSSELKRLNAYARLPMRLEQASGELAMLQKDDSFGNVERLQAIAQVFRGCSLGTTIDLGGNAGFFCLSLIDTGMITQAKVYDVSARALQAGEIMAKAMGCADKITFAKRAIDLEFLSNLAKVDTIVCLNLLHHAGTKFDVDIVQREGFESYAAEWLRILRDKCDRAVVSLGFEPKKPANWRTPPQTRPARFAQIAAKAGWSLLYDANVGDIRTLGIENANGRYTRQGMTLPVAASAGALAKSTKKLSRKLGLHVVRSLFNRAVGRSTSVDRRQKYHLYLLTRE